MVCVTSSSLPAKPYTLMGEGAFLNRWKYSCKSPYAVSTCARLYVVSPCFLPSHGLRSEMQVWVHLPFAASYHKACHWSRVSSLICSFVSSPSPSSSESYAASLFFFSCRKFVRSMARKDQWGVRESPCRAKVGAVL